MDGDYLMDNIFDKMNNIDDNESLPDAVSLKDALDGAIVVVVDDARTFDIQSIVDEFAKDSDDEEPVDEAYLEEAYDRSRHIFVSPSEVKEFLDKVSHCRYFNISKKPKNAKFFKDNSLTKDDVIAIIKQLEVVDYCYTLESTNEYHAGALLTVFITDKEFKLKDRTLTGVRIYAKIEYTDEGFVCVVSLHEPLKMEPHPYA